MSGPGVPCTARADAIDAALGDPRAPDAPLTFDRSVRLDQSAAFPQQEFDAVVATGLQDEYVPAAYGGTLVDMASPVLAVRAVARRDLTVAVAHGKTFLGAVCAWVAAPELARTVVAPMVRSGASVSWGLTERSRGSDLLATRTAAVQAGRGWRLSGEKWLINNATRGRAMTVLARTGAEPGPRALSLLFLDKDEVDRGRLVPVTKQETHGIRGADISGLGFDEVTLPADRLVGAPGHGLEVVLKSLQVTRTLCTALSLGAGDAILRAAIEFADERVLYGRRLVGLPAAQDVLADAVLDLAVAEAVAFAGARHLQCLPRESALVSPVVKYLVPTLVDGLGETLTRFVGARAVLVDGPYAHVQKAVRDNKVVGIFDGNSVVNLHAIVNEFAAVSRDTDIAALPAGLLADVCTTPWQAGELQMRTRAGSTLVRRLPALVDAVASDVLGPEGRDVARRIADRSNGLRREVAGLRPQRHPDPERFRAAHEYTVTFAAAAVLALAAEQHPTGGFWSVPGRVERALARLVRRLDPARPGAERPVLGHVARSAARGLVDDARSSLCAGRSVGAFSGAAPTWTTTTTDDHGGASRLLGARTVGAMS